MARSILFTFALLSLCLGAANLPAQQLERNAPPLPAVIPPPPPDPDTLPPPTPLEWESLKGSAPPQPVTSAGAALPVPLPGAEAADSVPLPPSPVALFVSGLPDPEPFILATPWVEVWRAGAQAPEFITQTEQGPNRVLIAIGTQVLVRLLFDPSLTGMPVTVKRSGSVILQPEVEAINIGPGGECLFQVQMDDQSQAEIYFYSEGVETMLPLQSVPLSMIEVDP